MNSTEENSIVLGFVFRSSFVLRGLEISLFNCLSWNIASPTINVYGHTIFPAFVSSLATRIGGIDTTNNQDCESLTTISIPIQSQRDYDVYFIEITYDNEPNVQWVHTAEIKFSDETPVPSTTIVSSITAATTMVEETTVSMETTTVEETTVSMETTGTTFIETTDQPTAGKVTTSEN